MKRTDLDLIGQYFAATRPDMLTAPVIAHTEWRRIVTAVGASMQGAPWAHLYRHDRWLAETGAEVREPTPTEGEPYELEGAWYNLTESDALDRGLVADPSAPCWRVPRNLSADGTPYRDASACTIMDAITGEWRNMTVAETMLYPAPPPVDPATYADARESSGRSDYCRVTDPAGSVVCTRPRGHTGLHAAMQSNGVLYRTPWSGRRPAPAAAIRAAASRECGDEYEDDDGEIHSCTERRGHDDETSSHYDPDIEHSDGDVTW